MGAKRSRTHRWRDCLEQILERGGGIEIAVKSPESGERATSLVWRVRLYAINGDHLVVEAPGTMGRTFEIHPGTPVVGVMSVGQNRWMFDSVVQAAVSPCEQRKYPALQLSLPEEMKRCRRSARVSTTELSLPEVMCWPLLDADSAVPAELANCARIRELQLAKRSQAAAPELEALLLPNVGPQSKALLANLGGGGVGLRFGASEPIELDSRNLYWLRLDLRPWIPAPLAVTARMAHAFTDASHQMHAGFAFDFAHNQAHRDFVIEQIERCMKQIQSDLRSAA